jgi:hypothetical protein
VQYLCRDAYHVMYPSDVGVPRVRNFHCVLIQSDIQHYSILRLVIVTAFGPGGTAFMPPGFNLETTMTTADALVSVGVYAPEFSFTHAIETQPQWGMMVVALTDQVACAGVQDVSVDIAAGQTQAFGGNVLFSATSMNGTCFVGGSTTVLNAANQVTIFGSTSVASFNGSLSVYVHVCSEEKILT